MKGTQQASKKWLRNTGEGKEKGLGAKSQTDLEFKEKGGSLVTSYWTAMYVLEEWAAGE